MGIKETKELINEYESLENALNSNLSPKQWKMIKEQLLNVFREHNLIVAPKTSSTILRNIELTILLDS